MQKKGCCFTIMFIIIRDFLMIITQVGIYKLPHELTNDLRLGDLGNQKMSEKSQNFTELLLVLRPPHEMKILSLLAKSS